MYRVLIWFLYNNVSIFGKLACNWWNRDGPMTLNLRYFRKWTFGHWIDFSLIFEFCQLCWPISSRLFITSFTSGGPVDEKSFPLHFEKGNNRANLTFNHPWSCFKFRPFDALHTSSATWKINLSIWIIFPWRENTYDHGVSAKSQRWQNLSNPTRCFAINGLAGASQGYGLITKFEAQFCWGMLG